MERITWDQYFMAQSFLLSLRSTCNRLSVGATIVRDKRIIAGGYNGSIAGGDHCLDKGCYLVDNHCVRTIHAEMNALLQCAKFGVSTEGAEIYVTHFPCTQCTKAIIQAGIQTIYYAEDYKNDPFALELLEQAKVKVEKVPFDKEMFDWNYEEKTVFIRELFEKLHDHKLTDEMKERYWQKAKELFPKI
ncbi:ComE operon protein 2 [Fervidibacillus albus]|uniref:ComE operon protein 2 n=1 Tax=Fervidibacillus albus TaxID=2980026 RepID=A0A9E8LVR5_9BACI|nr:ComE operon protein 2 [Fervidibacillus albus]WAA10357.1 ComE operon protein 2 [Fervidibacillus albus]